MKTSRRTLLTAVAVVGGLGLLLAGSWFIIERGVSRVLARQATVLAEQWAAYLGANLPDVERLVAGYPPDREQVRFLRGSSATADVFRWRLFDASGTLTFDTRYFDEVTAGWTLPADPSLADGTGWAGAGGAWPRARVEEGDGVLRPSFYAVALDRVVIDGERIGTLELYIDQTAQRVDLLRTLLSAGLSQALLTVLAFLVPVAGLLWQVRGRTAADAAREHAATHDALTGLLNRYAFGEIVDARIAREPLSPFCLLVFNIADFRKVNDARGHHVGDEVLRCVGWRLRRTVSGRSALCRLGADEFAVADAACSDPREAEELARRCLRAVREPLNFRSGPLSVALDCGIVQYPRDGSDAAQLLKKADFAISAAGEEGGNVRAFEPSMERARARQLEVELRLRRAVDDEDFRLVFQPFFSPVDGALLGAEALLRLDCAGGATISPAEFIPVAEETRLIVPLSAHVLCRACSIAAGWPDDLLIAVNLSPIDFDRSGAVGATREALSASGLPATRLEVEVTEGALIADPDRVAMQLDELKEMGVRLALDDFGTGYSNLGHIARYPFDRLKIDRSFIVGVAEGGPRSGQMLRVIVAIGDLLDLDVTAEGIETPKQAEAVRRLGVTCAQGFYYSMPLELGDFESLVAARAGQTPRGAGTGTEGAAPPRGP